MLIYCFNTIKIQQPQFDLLILETTTLWVNTTESRSQIQVHTDECTQIHSAMSSLVITHPNTNRGRCDLTSVSVPWSPRLE